jgi:hypothetical protein
VLNKCKKKLVDKKLFWEISRVFEVGKPQWPVWVGGPSLLRLLSPAKNGVSGLGTSEVGQALC